MTLSRWIYNDKLNAFSKLTYGIPFITLIRESRELSLLNN